MQFVNKRAAPIQVMWVDFEGAEKKYVVVQPGKSATLSTFVNHVWLVRDKTPEGSVLGTLKARVGGGAAPAALCWLFRRSALPLRGVAATTTQPP